MLFPFAWVSLMQPSMPTFSDLIDVLVAIRMLTALLAISIALSPSHSQIDGIQLVQGDTVNAWIVSICPLIIPSSGWVIRCRGDRNLWVVMVLNLVSGLDFGRVWISIHNFVAVSVCRR